MLVDSVAIQTIGSPSSTEAPESLFKASGERKNLDNLFREPIKRLWSHCVNLSYDIKGWHDIIKPPLELFYEYIDLPQFQNLYVDVKNKFEKIFDNVLFLSTEKFYTNQEEYYRLSEFLGISTLTSTNSYENKTFYDDNFLSSKVIEIATEKLLPSIEIYRQL